MTVAAAAVHVLLIDEQQDQLPLVVEFLMRRDCRIESCADPAQATGAVERRRQTGDPYHAVIMASRRRDLTLIGALHRRDPSLRIAFCSPYAQVDQALVDAAQRQGCSLVFDQPIDLTSLERFIEDTRRLLGTGASTRTSHTEDRTPFFGTARIPTTSTIRATVPAPPMRPPTGSSGIRHPGTTTGYTRQRSEYFEAAPHMPVKQFTTSRLRRSVDGKAQTDDGQPATSSYGRQPSTVSPHIDTRSIANDQKKVACAFCSKFFLVSRKAEAYTVLCIHCGKMNRILPG